MLDISACLSPQCPGVGFPVLPGFREQHLHPQLLQDPPHLPGPAPNPAPRLQVQPPRAGLLCPPASRSMPCQVNSHFTPSAASCVLGCGTSPSPPATPWGCVHQLGLWRMGALGPPKNHSGLRLGDTWCWGRHMLALVGSGGLKDGITLGWHCPAAPSPGRGLLPWQFSAQFTGGRSAIANDAQGNEPDLFAVGLRPAQECGRWRPRAGSVGIQSLAGPTPALGTRAPARCSRCCSCS